MRRSLLSCLLVTSVASLFVVPSAAQSDRPTSRPTSRPARRQRPTQPRKQPARRTDRDQRRAAQKFRRYQMPGDDVEKNVRRLKKLFWHKSLRAAAKVARARNKPILWIQALGDLNGFT